MLIAGLDLAAEPKATALAVLDWPSQSHEKVKLVSLEVGVDDKRILDQVASFEKLGIDCALGLPVEFVDFLKSFGSADLGDRVFAGDIDWRRRLAYRETDREVRRITGRWPLSVSTDRLGMTALRCAGLLTKLQGAGIAVDRSGLGKVVEIYPAASMRIWGFDTAGYRNSTGIRQQLIHQLKAEADWLNLGGFEGLMVESCDALDSVIAALAAASSALGISTSPQPHQLAQAKVEGWVSLPTAHLRDLPSN
jgi:predicted nuclease with RNAse H fold